MAGATTGEHRLALETIKELQGERIASLERRVEEFERWKETHTKIDSEAHAAMIHFIEMKAAATFGFKALMWLAAFGAALATFLVALKNWGR